MKDIFLCKGWSVDTGKPVIGLLIRSYHPPSRSYREAIQVGSGTGKTRAYSFEIVDPMLIVPCTGIKDKTGALYFQGDVGQFDNGSRFIIHRDPDTGCFSIRWIDAHLAGNPAMGDDFTLVSEATIVGTDKTGKQ